MIKSLTPEQIAKFPEYVKEYIALGTNTDRISYDEAVDIAHNVQRKLLDKEPTAVILVDNPIEAWVACNYAVNGVRPNDLLKKVEEYFKGEDKIQLQEYTTPYLCGSMDVATWAFFDYFQKEIGISFEDKQESYDVWRSTAKAGLMFPLDDVFIITQKPTTVKLNEQNRAHCDGGPALEYAGTYFNYPPQYMLNGVKVPDWLACKPSSQLKVEDYNLISNADVRMEFVKKFGVERMLSMGKKVDSYEKYNEEWWTKSEYELWDMSILFKDRNISYAPHLKMLNQTTGVWHVEAVSPNCRTLADAVKERMGGVDLEIKGIA